MLNLLNVYNTSNETFIKNLLIAFTIPLLVTSFYLVSKQSKIINSNEEVINSLKGEVSSLKFDLKELNSKLLHKEYENFNTKHKNIYNWNNIFQEDVYEVYKNSNELQDFIYFPHDTFLTLTVFKLMRLTFLEDQVSGIIKKIIFKHPLNLNNNNFNYSMVHYECELFFNKIRYLYLDCYINDLLYKRYGSSYPLFNRHYTPLNQIIEKEKIPYSFSPNYTKKYHFNNLYKNLNYTNRGISSFI